MNNRFGNSITCWVILLMCSLLALCSKEKLTGHFPAIFSGKPLSRKVIVGRGIWCYKIQSFDLDRLQRIPLNNSRERGGFWLGLSCLGFFLFGFMFSPDRLSKATIVKRV